MTILCAQRQNNFNFFIRILLSRDYVIRRVDHESLRDSFYFSSFDLSLIAPKTKKATATAKKSLHTLLLPPEVITHREHVENSDDYLRFSIKSHPLAFEGLLDH